MPLIAKDKGGVESTPLAAGMHHAICYAVIDIGTQPSFGQFPPRRKVLFIWEVPGERIEITKDGSRLDLPRAISARYTLSLASKGNLRPMLESWRGRPFTPEELDGFDVLNVAGANCFLNVVHQAGKGDKANRTYANVASVNPLAKGMAKLQPENALLTFTMAGAVGPLSIPATIPEWIADLIEQSDEFKALNEDKPEPRQTPDNFHPVANQEIDDDSVPF